MYEPGMIVCHMGSLGSGKTLDMTYQAYMAWLQYRMPVYCNYETFWDEFYRIKSMKHLVTRTNGLLCIDEMQAILDSREFGKNVDITQWLLLIRKVGLGLFYTTQHIDFVDVRLRQITDYVFVHSKVFDYGLKSSMIEIYRMSGNVASYVTKGVLHHEQWMYDLYNSYDRKVKLTLDGYTYPFKPEWLEEDNSDTNGDVVLSLPEPVAVTRPQLRRGAAASRSSGFIDLSEV